MNGSRALEIVRQLIKKGATIDGLRGADETPLQSAAAGGHSEVVDLLLAKGADAKAENNIRISISGGGYVRLSSWPY